MTETPTPKAKPDLLAPILVVAVVIAAAGGFWLIDPLGLRTPAEPAPVPETLAEQLASGQIALGKPMTLEEARSGQTAPPPSDLDASPETLAAHSKACEGGAGEDCYYAGRQLEIGLGVDQDETQAAAFYDRACTLGSAQACSSAGAMVIRGSEDAASIEKADAYYRRACELGETEFCD